MIFFNVTLAPYKYLTFDVRAKNKKSAIRKLRKHRREEIARAAQLTIEIMKQEFGISTRTPIGIQKRKIRSFSKARNPLITATTNL